MKKPIVLLLLLLSASYLFAQGGKSESNGKAQEEKGKITETKQDQSEQESQFVHLAEGASGVKRSISYRFSISNADEDPGNGMFRYNSDSTGSISMIYVDNVDFSGEDQSKWFATWDDTTGATGRGRISVAETNGRVFTVYDITGVMQQSDGYWKIPVEYISGIIPEDGTVCYYVFERIAGKKKTDSQQEKENNKTTEPPLIIADVVTPVHNEEAPVIIPEVVKETPGTTPVEVVPVQKEEAPVVIPEVIKETPVTTPVEVVPVQKEEAPVVIPEVVKETPVTIPVEVVPVQKEEAPVVIPEVIKETPVTIPVEVVPVQKEEAPVVIPEVIKETPVTTPVEVVPVQKEEAPVVIPEVIKETPVTTPVEVVPVQKEESPVVIPEVIKETPVTTPVEVVPVQKEEAPVVIPEVIKETPVTTPVEVVPVQKEEAPVVIPEVIKETPVTTPVEVVPVQKEEAPVVIPEVVKETPVTKPVVNVESAEVDKQPIKHDTDKTVIPGRLDKSDRQNVQDQGNDRRKENPTNKTPQTNQVISASQQINPIAENKTKVPDIDRNKVQNNQIQDSKTTNRNDYPVNQNSATNANKQSSVVIPQQNSSADNQTVISNQSKQNYSLPTYEQNSYNYSEYENHRKWYSGIIELGYGLGIGKYGMNNFRFNFINGIKITQSTSIGLGIGFRRFYEERSAVWHPDSSKMQIPVYIDFRTNFSTRTVTPYLSLGIGNSSRYVTGNSKTVKEGLFMNCSGGIWFNLSERTALFAGVAYEMQKLQFAADDASTFKEYARSVSLNIGFSF